MELRDEIVESQKTRVDLLKWKIILAATLCAVALGFEGTPPSAAPFSHEYLLCLIPLICLYVDLLCAHLNLRIMVIARYVQFVAATRGSTATPRQAEYEEFAEDARNMTSDLVKQGKQPQHRRAKHRWSALNVFSFEDLAQHLSSGILSLFVFLWGVSLLRQGGDWKFFMQAGAAGLALSALAYWEYQRRLRALCGLVERWKKQKSRETGAG